MIQGTLPLGLLAVVVTASLAAAETVSIRVSDRMLHGAATGDVRYSPDGRYLATSDRDGVVIVWDAEQRTEHGRLVAHAPGLVTLAFRGDGAELATGDAEGVVRIWSMATLAQPRLTLAALRGPETSRRFRPPGIGVRGLAFAPDGESIAATCDRWAVLWSARTGLEQWRWECAREQDGARPRPPGPPGNRRPAGGFGGGGRSAAPDAVGCAFVLDGRELAIVDSENHVSLHDPASGAVLRRLPSPGRGPDLTPMGRAMAVSRDGRWLVTIAGVEPVPAPDDAAPPGGFGAPSVPGVRVWDVETGAVVCEVAAAQGLTQQGIAGLTLDATGRRLAVATNVVSVWSIPEARRLAVHRILNQNRSQSNENVGWIDLAPDGGRVAYGHRALAYFGHEVRTWIVGEPDEAAIPSSFDCAVALSGDGRRLAVADLHDGRARFRLGSLDGDGPLRVVATVANTAPVRIALSPTGDILAWLSLGIGEDAIDVKDPFAVHLLDTSSGQTRSTSSGTGEVAKRGWFGAQLAFAPDGSGLAIARGAEAGVVELRSVPGLELERTIEAGAGVGGLEFSADGALLATSLRDGRVRLWSPVDGVERSVVDGDLVATFAVAFDPAGGRVAFGGGDEFVLCDLRTERVIGRLVRTRGWWVSARFSRDGRAVLLSGGGRIDRWEIALGVVAVGWAGSGGILLGATADDRLASLHRDGTVKLIDAGEPAGEAATGVYVRPVAVDGGPAHVGRRVGYWIRRLGMSFVPNEIYGRPQPTEPRAALRAIGPAATPDVALLLSDPRWWVRQAAAETLGSWGAPSRVAAPTLIEALGRAETSEDVVVAQAIRAVDAPGVADALPGLIDLARRRQMSETVGGSSIARLVDTLAGDAGAEALTAAPRWPELLVVTLGLDRRDRTWAADQLQALGPRAAEALPFLIAELENGPVATSLAVVSTLQSLGAESKPAIPALRAFRVRVEQDDALQAHVRRELLRAIDAALSSIEP